MYTTFLKRYGENLKNVPVPLRYRPLFTLVKWFGGISHENVKSMNKKCSNFEDFQYRLVAWRNSTRNDRFSSSEKMFGRHLRRDLAQTFLSLD